MRRKKNQHTPGPWKVGSDTDETMTIEVTDGREACILAELTECVPDDEDRANFALMAMAPDLLEVLKYLRGVADSNVRGVRLGGIEIADRAIAKAEGRR